MRYLKILGLVLLSASISMAVMFFLLFVFYGCITYESLSDYHKLLFVIGFSMMINPLYSYFKKRL